jgi:hypothetical protein
LVFFLLPLKEL